MASTSYTDIYIDKMENINNNFDNDLFDAENEPYIEAPWDIIKSYLQDKGIFNGKNILSMKLKKPVNILEQKTIQILNCIQIFREF